MVCLREGSLSAERRDELMNSRKHVGIETHSSIVTQQKRGGESWCQTNVPGNLRSAVNNLG